MNLRILRPLPSTSSRHECVPTFAFLYMDVRLVSNINNVVYRPVAERWLGKHVPVARQQIINTATVGLQQWNNCFLRDPYLDVISKGQSQLLVLYGGPWRKQLVARVFSWKSGCEQKILCVILGVCNSVWLL
jgi:hypothetical protein